jgi:hypothetical protein
MRIAHDQAGQPIEANAAAPSQAICPSCGGGVVLRSRAAVNDLQKTYFWRHAHLVDLNCSERRSPYRLAATPVLAHSSIVHQKGQNP